MKLLLKSSLMLLMLVLAPGSFVQAAETDMEALKKALVKRLPSAAGATIKASPVKGLYEVVAGGQVMYMTEDARYIIDGDLFDMQNKKNITEDARSGVRLEALNLLGEDNMLVYTPKGDVKHTITIFTDIYCPYCQRLHAEMSDYMKNGVKVRYIFVPFKGAKSVNTSVSVWCAKDRNKALDMAKSGEKVEPKTCDHPINKHQELATRLGIRGTPAIMLESGQLMPGYVPSAKIISQINSAL